MSPRRVCAGAVPLCAKGCFWTRGCLTPKPEHLQHFPAQGTPEAGLMALSQLLTFRRNLSSWGAAAALGRTGTEPPSPGRSEITFPAGPCIPCERGYGHASAPGTVGVSKVLPRELSKVLNVMH